MSQICDYCSPNLLPCALNLEFTGIDFPLGCSLCPAGLPGQYIPPTVETPGDAWYYFNNPYGSPLEGFTIDVDARVSGSQCRWDYNGTDFLDRTYIKSPIYVELFNIGRYTFPAYPPESGFCTTSGTSISNQYAKIIAFIENVAGTWRWSVTLYHEIVYSGGAGTATVVIFAHGRPYGTGDSVTMDCTSPAPVTLANQAVRCRGSPNTPYQWGEGGTVTITPTVDCLTDNSSSSQSRTSSSSSSTSSDSSPSSNSSSSNSSSSNSSSSNSSSSPSSPSSPSSKSSGGTSESSTSSALQNSSSSLSSISDSSGGTSESSDSSPHSALSGSSNSNSSSSSESIQSVSSASSTSESSNSSSSQDEFYGNISIAVGPNKNKVFMVGPELQHNTLSFHLLKDKFNVPTITVSSFYNATTGKYSSSEFCYNEHPRVWGGLYTNVDEERLNFFEHLYHGAPFVEEVYNAFLPKIYGTHYLFSDKNISSYAGWFGNQFLAYRYSPYYYERVYWANWGSILSGGNPWPGGVYGGRDANSNLAAFFRDAVAKNMIISGNAGPNLGISNTLWDNYYLTNGDYWGFYAIYFNYEQEQKTYLKDYSSNNGISAIIMEYFVVGAGSTGYNGYTGYDGYYVWQALLIKYGLSPTTPRPNTYYSEGKTGDVNYSYYKNSRGIRYHIYRDFNTFKKKIRNYKHRVDVIKDENVMYNHGRIISTEGGAIHNKVENESDIFYDLDLSFSKNLTKRVWYQEELANQYDSLWYKLNGIYCWKADINSTGGSYDFVKSIFFDVSWPKNKPFMFGSDYIQYDNYAVPPIISDTRLYIHNYDKMYQRYMHSFVYFPSNMHNGLNGIFSATVIGDEINNNTVSYLPAIDISQIKVESEKQKTDIKEENKEEEDTLYSIGLEDDLTSYNAEDGYWNCKMNVDFRYSEAKTAYLYGDVLKVNSAKAKILKKAIFDKYKIPKGRCSTVYNSKGYIFVFYEDEEDNISCAVSYDNAENWYNFKTLIPEATKAKKPYILKDSTFTRKSYLVFVLDDETLCVKPFDLSLFAKEDAYEAEPSEYFMDLIANQIVEIEDISAYEKCSFSGYIDRKGVLRIWYSLDDKLMVKSSNNGSDWFYSVKDVKYDFGNKYWYYYADFRPGSGYGDVFNFGPISQVSQNQFSNVQVTFSPGAEYSYCIYPVYSGFGPYYDGSYITRVVEVKDAKLRYIDSQIVYNDSTDQIIYYTHFDYEQRVLFKRNNEDAEEKITWRTTSFRYFYNDWISLMDRYFDNGLISSDDEASLAKNTKLSDTEKVNAKKIWDDNINWSFDKQQDNIRNEVDTNFLIHAVYGLNSDSSGLTTSYGTGWLPGVSVYWNQSIQFYYSNFGALSPGEAIWTKKNMPVMTPDMYFDKLGHLVVRRFEVQNCNISTNTTEVFSKDISIR